MSAKSTIISFFGIPVFFYSSVFLLQPNGILCRKKIPYIGTFSKIFWKNKLTLCYLTRNQ